MWYIQETAVINQSINQFIYLFESGEPIEQ